MPVVNVPPTRSNLIRLKHELEFARQGYEILDRKREALTSELIRLAHDAEVFQQELWKRMNEAYHALEKAQLLMGREQVEWAALAAPKSVDVHLRFRGIMGVALPLIESQVGIPKIRYSLGDTSASLDEATATFQEVLKRIPELSRLVTTVFRLAKELQKTQRRVKALQNIFIPQYEDTIAYIISTLEEHEREEFFRLKLLKNRKSGTSNRSLKDAVDQTVQNS
jgi:V/A-type H+-transporting ATPase subunit D